MANLGTLYEIGAVGHPNCGPPVVAIGIAFFYARGAE
jgi:hypothetical protein